MNMLLNFTHLRSQTFLAAGVYVAIAIGTTVHILLYKDDVKSSMGWIALVFLSPFIGTILYVFLGINRIKRKGIKLRNASIAAELYVVKGTENAFKYLPEKYKQFVIFGYNTYPQEFVFGNSIKPLQNGVNAYPEMLRSIQNAKKEVLVASYIFDCDSETDKFLEAFKTAIKNGVVVKVLVDGLGALKFFHSSIEKKLSKIKGLEYGAFLPLYIPISMPFINLRNHRKIMIIDGKTAFFGGMNLSKQNTLINDIKNGVLDLTFKINGPVIEQIIQVFKEDWEFATGKKFQSLSAKNHSVAGKCGNPARVIPDGPDGKNKIIEAIIHGAINAATKKITITTPYFLPEDNILTAIEMASMRGVEVEIILPNKNDFLFINWASEPNFLRLIKSGVKIYRSQNLFDHSKMFTMDNKWVFIGSANWDVRSFKLNFESNMEIFSEDLAKELNTIFESKKKKAKLIPATDCENLPFLKRIRNNACRLLTPYC